ncbi:DeoR family transcriptional regulator [Candidatus Pelagibacter sp.]|nr:DeoR family transcriptional regulator [Candidatus Pelagibacter sp.]
MSKFLPELSKQIHTEVIREVIEKNYASIMPVWTPLQLTWVNSLYRTFHDYEKYMIVMYLLKTTFETYAKNLTTLNYDEYFNQFEFEIEKINVMEISKSLNIAKETTRRKINELEKIGVIKKINKKIIIDRNTWPNIKPDDTIERITRFLSTLSKICVAEKKISEPFSNEILTKICKEYFSFVWTLYYEMQFPMLLGFKKVFGDLESFHVNGVCIINQALNSKKHDNSEMSKEFYLEKYMWGDQRSETGVNAMSISDITGIPRATVIRKLNKLLKEKFLKVDNKKHYSSTGHHAQKLLEVQKITFDNLSKFTARVYNLCLMKND